MKDSGWVKSCANNGWKYAVFFFFVFYSIATKILCQVYNGLHTISFDYPNLASHLILRAFYIVFSFKQFWKYSSPHHYVPFFSKIKAFKLFHDSMRSKQIWNSKKLLKHRNMANWNACVVYSLCVRGNRAQRLKHHVKHNNFIGPDFLIPIWFFMLENTFRRLLLFISSHLIYSSYKIL